MNILYISPFLPFPPDHGGKLRIFNILSRIARHHQVHLVAFVEERDQHILHPPELAQICANVTYINVRTRYQMNKIQALLSPLPLLAFEYDFPEARATIQRILQSEQFQVAVLEQLQVGVFIEMIHNANVPVMFVSHNIEHQLWNDFARIGTSMKVRMHAQFEIPKVKHMERKTLKLADMRVAVSPVDQHVLEEMCGKSVDISPNGVDIEFFSFLPPSKRHLSRPYRLIMTASYQYLPNADAAQFFLDEIYPLLSQQSIQTETVFVGKDPPKRLVDHANQLQHVSFQGFVKDIRAYVQQSHIFIVPLRTGSGTRLKILEAMAQGIPVVTTSVGCEGLYVTHQKHVWIADTPATFIEGITKLIQHPELAESLAYNARTLVEQVYDWNSIAVQFEQHLLQLGTH